MRRFTLALGLAVTALACNTGPTPEPTPAPPAKTAAPVVAQPQPQAQAQAQPQGGSLRLGTPIEANAQKVTLAEVAKAPSTFAGKTFATTGTVTAVCQHMGCWMEIKDDASEAHIKMAGHAFFVPKTASGRKARVLGKLAPAANAGACEGEGHEGMAAAGGGGAKEKGKGCRAEAEEQLGRPLAKLELVADGVELM